MLGFFLRGKRGKVSKGEPVSVITVSRESPGLDPKKWCFLFPWSWSVLSQDLSI